MNDDKGVIMVILVDGQKSCAGRGFPRVEGQEVGESSSLEV